MRCRFGHGFILSKSTWGLSRWVKTKLSVTGMLVTLLSGLLPVRRQAYGTRLILRNLSRRLGKISKLFVEAEFVSQDGVLKACDKLSNILQKSRVVPYLWEFKNLFINVPDISEFEKLVRFREGLKRQILLEVIKRVHPCSNLLLILPSNLIEHFTEQVSKLQDIFFKQSKWFRYNLEFRYTNVERTRNY